MVSDRGQQNEGHMQDYCNLDNHISWVNAIKQMKQICELWTFAVVRFNGNKNFMAYRPQLKRHSEMLNLQPCARFTKP